MNREKRVVQVKEFRFDGARNFIRVGDLIKVTAKPPVDKKGFDAIVRRIDADEQGNIVQVEVIPKTGKSSNIGKIRTITPERIERKAQTKNGVRKQVAR